MKDAGYKTSAFCKWGLGYIGSTGDPKNQGCDTFYGYNCQLLAHSYYPDHLWDNDKRVELEDNNLNVQYGKGTYSQDLIHGKALEYLDNMNPDEPFFMWYPTIIPHAELIVPEDSIIQKFRGMYPEKPYKGTEPGARLSAREVTVRSSIHMQLSPLWSTVWTSMSGRSSKS